MDKKAVVADFLTKCIDYAYASIERKRKRGEDGLIPAIANISVPATDDYVLVFDAADGPNSNSADENTDWVWEFMVLSDGNSMTNLQAIDNQYENSISVGTLNAPDSDSDGIRNGVDECPSTPAGASVDASGCSSSELDDVGEGTEAVNDEEAYKKCVEWRSKYNVILGESWGTLPYDLQTSWKTFGCDYHLTEGSSLLSEGEYKSQFADR